MKVHSRIRRSFSLVSTIFSIALIGTTVLGTLALIVQTYRLDRLSKERNLANRAMKTTISDIASTQLGTFLAVYDPVALPGGETQFNVSGLKPQVDGAGNPLSIGRIIIQGETGPWANSEVFTVWIEIRWDSMTEGPGEGYQTVRATYIYYPPLA